MTEAYLNNDHTLTVADLQTAASPPVALTAATITYQIYDEDDVAVDGASGTLAQIGTSGDYTTEVDEDIVNLLTRWEEYTIRLTGSNGGYDFEFDIPIRCMRRVVSS